MRALVALLLAACQQAHVVTLQLGPDDQTLSAGFNCFEDGTMRSLAARALQPDGSLRLSIVIDIISLGDQFPGCRGEELIKACDEPGTCSIVPRPDGTRYCRDVAIDRAVVATTLDGDLGPLLEAIRAELQMEQVTVDAPNEPVIIRSIATAESTCGDVPATFDPTLLVGCAYSCPVQLDEVDGPIALSLDTLTRQCEGAVRACASFPP